MLTYKEFRKKLLTELEQRGIKFEITSMTSVNGEKERISIAFSNFTTDNAVDSDHKPETFGLYPDHEYANYLGLCESESESPVERIVDDALQIMSQLSEKVSLEYVNSLLKLRDEDIIYQLINAKKNEELLKKVPHRIVADDLAVIYRIYKTEIDENSDEKLVTSTIILNSVMEESRYTEEKEASASFSFVQKTGSVSFSFILILWRKEMRKIEDQHYKTKRSCPVCGHTLYSNHYLQYGIPCIRYTCPRCRYYMEKSVQRKERKK